MLRIALSFLLAANAALATTLPAFGQAAGGEPVVLESRTASRALDAVPAVFAVAQNLEGVDLDLSIDGLANGYSELASLTAAQEQLTTALSVYDFENYGVWAATIKTVFSTNAYIRAKGLTASEVNLALQEVLHDVGIPQTQKDTIAAEMKSVASGSAGADVVAPLFDNLVVVIGLLPQVESTITMMQAMQ